MHSLIAHLNEPAFFIGDTPTSWAELYGFVTGLACVALAAAKRISTFPIGILGSLFFLVLFWDARLWADAGLQVVFVILGFHGWWLWARMDAREEEPMGDASPQLLLWIGVAIVAFALLLWPILAHTHDSAPELDATTTSMSLGAQFLLNQKLRQTWYFWIAVDCIYVPLYLDRDLILTAIVYFVFLCICLVAVWQWRRPAQTPALA